MLNGLLLQLQKTSDLLVLLIYRSTHSCATLCCHSMMVVTPFVSRFFIVKSNVDSCWHSACLAERNSLNLMLDTQFIYRGTCCSVDNMYNIYEYCFTSLSAQAWQYQDRRKPEVGTMPYSYFE